MCGHDVKTYISYFPSQIAFFACTWEISVGWGEEKNMEPCHSFMKF